MKKLDPEVLGSEPLVLVGIRIPKSMLAAIDAAAMKLDPSCPNRSLYMRNAIYRSLSKEAA
jgi:hypothetical protein